jgi:3-oxosteroid 1-dehydrogenase
MQEGKSIGAIAGRELDLIVVGSGAAGLTGALVAALGGARVAVVEKTGLVGGTTSMSGGGAWLPLNSHTTEVGVTDSREEALAYIRACVGDAGEDDHIVALVDNGHKMIRLLEEKAGMTMVPWPSVGGTIDYRPWLPGAKHGGRTLSCGPLPLSELGEEWAAKLRKAPGNAWFMDPMDYYAKKMHLQRPSPTAVNRRGGGANAPDVYGRGTGLVGQLLRGGLANGVTVLTETAAKELIVEGGRVAGVKVERGGEIMELRSKRGVLMATGGYTNNEKLKQLWMTRPLLYTCDIDTNQGDGHLMGAAVGAQLAGLGDAWWMPQIPLGVDNGVVNAGGTREDRILPHTMIVNRSARRFMNEAVNYYDAGESFGTKVGAAPRDYPAWFIFDQQGAERYALLAWKIPASGNAEWVKVGNSVAQLAELTELDPDTLAETIERFNGFARSGKDEDFHRGDDEWDQAWGDPDNKPNSCLGTVEKPPFYALQVFPGALATRGGLRVNALAEVLAALTGEPIPGLYAAGNCSNGGPAGTYPGAGATIGSAMTFGYIAAKQILE